MTGSKKEKEKESSPMYLVVGEVQSKCDITPFLGLTSTAMSLILIHENPHPRVVDKLNALVDAGSSHASSTAP